MTQQITNDAGLTLWSVTKDGKEVGKIFATPASSRWQYEAFTLPPRVQSKRINTIEDGEKFILGAKKC